MPSAIAVGATGPQQLRHQVGQLVNLGFAETALRKPDGAQAQAGRVERAAISGNGVAVDDDVGHVQDAAGGVSHQWHAVCAAHRFAIYVEQVRVRAAEGYIETVLAEAHGHSCGVGANLFLQLPEFWRAVKFKDHGDGGHGVQVGATMLAGEDGAVDFAREYVVGGEDARTARAAQ